MSKHSGWLAYPNYDEDEIEAWECPECGCLIANIDCTSPDEWGWRYCPKCGRRLIGDAIPVVPDMIALIKEFVPVLPIDEEVVQEHYNKLSDRAAALLRRIEGEEETA